MHFVAYLSLLIAISNIIIALFLISDYFGAFKTDCLIMKTHLLPVGISLLALSCNQQPKVVVTKKADTISAKQKPDSPKYVQEAENEKIDYPDTPPDHGWIDSLLTAYVKNSGNELV
ncbi:hypothetical protein LX99_02955 [Mucilaginibacter oryzae]|uniref:Uncharacterized protein n=2 Tax=Mucilaginibacter oryzae TaxID=468058 RepID=A0A316HFY1_9SPHI|nr:hypothetical protein LX99_02955 [Mucilaginibacter oryzae]